MTAPFAPTGSGPVVVHWVDAAESNDVPLSHISENPIREFFIERQHTGWIVKQDSTGIILAHDRREGGKADIIAIPTRWILKVEKAAR